MSDPTFVTGYGQYYYLCDRDPTSSEPDCYLDISDFKYMWLNTTTGDFWWCSDNTTNAMVWQKLATSSNIDSVLSLSGWNLNSPRSYTSRISPAFNTAYTPSSSNDCFVMVIVNVISTLVTPGTVLFEMDDTGSFLTRGEASVSGVASSEFKTISAMVPASKSYKLINSSGTASIISINELLM